MQPTDNQRILAYLRAHQDDMVAHLVQLVKMESPSTDKAAVDRLGAALADQLRDLGASVDVLPQFAAGDHLRACWGTGPDGVLLLCHMDTVWEVGTLARMPVRIADGRLYGPGAFDMKGGIVNALWAIRALRELDLLPDRCITLLITSDEEVGSATSRSLIETEAVAHKAVYVLEPAHPPHGALKTWRKGVGMYRVRARGVAAHAGAAHDQGVNAIEELAHHILAIQALTDYAIGTTVNVGVVGGGTRSNAVPEEAWAAVDLRVMNQAEAERVDRFMRGLTPKLPGASVEVSGGLNRPPMVRTAATIALFGRAAAIAAELGFPVDETGTGGGSDGNFTAALGVPTLDGLGVAGDGGHAQHEHVIISSLPERAALLAGMLRG
ncbi:MAG: M20 family metallopeptidase [Anaerolineae bacterium]|nr:M20 family metallopeptidase [Anaerolineae bacterium]